MPPTDTTTEMPRELRPRPSRAEIDPIARAIVGRHGDEVMASAARWAETPEDAEDAFQRGLEIMLTKAPSTDPDHLVPWLKTVVKREAWAIRRQRERHTPPAGEYTDLDSPGLTSAHDEAETIERLHRGAEALRRLKPQEVRAFVLRAEGLTYQEICAETGWTYTKVNRCLSEGRRSFQDRLAGIESGAECERLAPLLSALADGEALAEDMALLRPHLRTCLMCRARLRDYRRVPARVAAAAPPVALLPALLGSAREALASASGWLSGLVTAHKGAAVVASAAVLGGGGVATVATVDGARESERPAAVAAPADASTAPPPVTSGVLPVPVADDRDERRRARHAPADRPPATARPEPARSKPRAEEPAAGEFAPAPAASTPPPAARPSPPGRPPAAREGTGGGEFAP